jgi:hypothetical protein
MHRSSLLLPLLLAAACGDTHDAVILSSLVPCTGIASQMCTQVVLDGETEHFFEGIEGFTFTWGAETTVRLSIEEIDDPPADASSRRYHLEQVINEERDDLGTRYELTFPPEQPMYDWFQPASSSGTIVAVDMLGTRVACETSVCNQLLGGSEILPTRVTFELTAEPLQPLRAIAVVR